MSFETSIVNGVYLRRAQNEDLVFISRKALEWKLDSENFQVDDFLIAEDIATKEILAFGRIKKYSSFWELATVGVIPEKRKQGLGQLMVLELINKFPSKKVWVTTDLVGYFQKFGFVEVQDGPVELLNKIDRCHCRQNRPGVKIMLLEKP